MSQTTAHKETHSTTVRLPKPLYEQAKIFVDEARLQSLNDLFVSAIRAYLKSADRRRIDNAFAAMSEDADYQKDATLIAEQFEESDWESLEVAEQDLEQ